MELELEASSLRTLRVSEDAMPAAKGEKQSVVLPYCNVYKPWRPQQYTLSGEIVSLISQEVRLISHCLAHRDKP